MPKITIHAASWLVNPKMEPVSGGAIAVQNGRIVACGTKNDLIRAFGSNIVIDYPDCAIIPGFINAHTHLELTHFPAWREQNGMGYAPRSFVDWMIQLIKINRGLTAQQLQSSISEGFRKCLQSGTTTIGDILSRYELLPLYSESSVRGRIFFELLGHDRIRFNQRFQDAQSAIKSLENNLKVLPALSPHSSYTIAEEHLSPISKSAATYNTPLAIHISESAVEETFMHDSSGKIAEQLYPFVDWKQYLTPPHRCSPTSFFDRNGLLTDKTMAVHCVHLTPADARIIKERGSSICLCPRSNERLDVGRAPVALFKKLEIPLALGTDSLASNDSLSLWDEIRFTLEHFKGILSPTDLFEIVTIGGAKALDLETGTGTLEPGKYADFQVVELKRAVSSMQIIDELINCGESGYVYISGECIIER